MNKASRLRRGFLQVASVYHPRISLLGDLMNLLKESRAVIDLLCSSDTAKHHHATINSLVQLPVVDPMHLQLQYTLPSPELNLRKKYLRSKPALVGRESDLNAARDAIFQPGGRRILYGPSGVGKSALCRELFCSLQNDTKYAVQTSLWEMWELNGQSRNSLQTSLYEMGW